MVLVVPLYAACPLVTDTIHTVAYGKYELDIGYGTTNTQTILVDAIGAVLHYGVLPQFDFAVAVPYTISKPAGLNDIYLHAKYRFLKYEDHGLAARLDFKLNNGDPYQGLGSGDNDCRILLIYTKMFGLTQINFNFGYVNTGINAGKVEDDYFAYNFAIEHLVFNSQGAVFAECVVNNSLSPLPTFVLLGLRLPFINGTKLDCGYAFGLNEKSIKNSLSAELHCEF